MLTKEELLTLLEREVVPALGCTEPVCVALCAADASHAVGGTVLSVKVEVSANLFKNGLSVGIPGCPHTGLNYAAALGANLAAPEKGLELFSLVTSATNAQAEALVTQGRVAVTIQDQETALYVHAQVTTTNGIGVSTIRDTHANIVFTQANDTVLFQKAPSAAEEQGDLYERLKGMTVAQLRHLVEELPAAALESMLAGARKNGELAAYGLEHAVGAGIGRGLHRLSDSGLLGQNLFSRTMLRTAACAEGRMSGCPYAVMSSAGSGNHGITAVIPVVEAARDLGASEATLSRALALSHITTLYIKQYLGRLSSVCGCAMAACAALMSAYLAADGVVVPATDGIVGATAEETVANMGLISHPGMTKTDRVILKIMLDKQNRA